MDVLIENVANALAAGLIIGCLYGLMCIGLGLIFGIMNVVNFAQGELLMLGMYVSLYLVSVWGVLAFLGRPHRSSARSLPHLSCSPAAPCCIVCCYRASPASARPRS